MSLEETKFHSGIWKIIRFDLVGNRFFFLKIYVENFSIFYLKIRKISQA